ncbi:MAG TPA: hypothetical protein VLB44_14525 [Kofleriaceae bacterium]|nr:hypothetical protein [Kofleriaceae bacterium]
MKTIEAITLTTVTGGAATVAGTKKLDDATEQALTKLSSDVKDLARGSTNPNSQLTTLMTVMMMSRFANR